jgi:hypothetical protein
VPRKQNPETKGLDEYGLPAIIHTEILVMLTGVTARRLHQLITDNRIPAECRFTGDKWRTTISLREIFGYYRRKADRAKPTGDALLETQNSLEDLRAKRLKNAKMARELLPRHVYVQAWGEILSSFKNRWLNFPDKMGVRCFRAKDKADAIEILEREIADIFATLNDPKFMEDIAAGIRDDEFETGPNRDSRRGADSAEDLEPEDT